MHSHPLLPAAPAARRHDARSAACAGLALLGLALATACDDARDPVRPEAARSAAPAAAQVGPTAARSLLAKGFARLLTTTSGVVAGTQTYNAAGGRVESRYDDLIPTDLFLTFNTLRSVLRGAPHAQLTPVLHYSTEAGAAACIATDRIAANGADVEVFARCERGGRPTPMLASVQVLDQDAPAAYATIAPDGTPSNPRQLARVERTATGRYRVFFHRDPLFPSGAKPIAFVTPRDESRGKVELFNNRCELASVGSRAERAGELGVEVDCFDVRGFRQDAAFNVVALAQLPRTAYALVGDFQRPFAGNSHNPAGQITVARLGTGTYRVAFEGIAQEWTDDGTAMVTAHGANGGTCVLDTWNRVAGTTGVRVDVQCRSTAGALADQRFAVLATTRH